MYRLNNRKAPKTKGTMLLRLPLSPDIVCWQRFGFTCTVETKRAPRGLHSRHVKKASDEGDTKWTYRPILYRPHLIRNITNMSSNRMYKNLGESGSSWCQ